MFDQFRKRGGSCNFEDFFPDLWGKKGAFRNASRESPKDDGCIEGELKEAEKKMVP